jgi:F0F1-type ATP synthase alpha subunit
MKTAKSMLPKNVGRKPVNVKISRMTGLIPAHVPYGRYTAGHRTIENFLAPYNNNQKLARLKVILNKMKRNQLTLGPRVKKLFNMSLVDHY